MKLNLKSILFTATLGLGMLYSVNVNAQSPCCGGADKTDKASCDTSKDGKKVSCGTSTSTTASAEATSGCSPSACRGAKTKFGEAKIISTLRLDLIALKAEIEKSQKPSFNARSYDIHNIIGETDDESLQIILKEVKIIETAFTEKLKYKATALAFPKNKAKQVSYLSDRIKGLKKTLLAKS